MSDMKTELEQFLEMLESDYEALKRRYQCTPTHEIIKNYIDDLKEILERERDMK